jgi:glycosyltransferase involved in cell wall biosynthesis
MYIDALIMGGKERRLLELVKGFTKENDVTCSVAVMNDNVYYKEIFELNVPIYFLIRKIKKDPAIFISLFNLCRKTKPDIIHVWDSMTALYAIPVAKLLRIKLINAMITEAPQRLDQGTIKRIRFSQKYSDIMLSNSAAGLVSYKVASNHGKVIHNGFAQNRIDKVEPKEIIRAKFNITESYIVGMVGALQERKDHRTFIKTAIEILPEKNDICFLIVGDGPLRQTLESMVPKQFISKIKFLGEQANVESIINIFDIGILMSNQKIHGEGISNAILEYMALGKPVIATNGGGTPEIVDEGITGFLIEESSVRNLKEKILLLLENKTLALTMGEAGRKRVNTEFSIEKMVKKTLELYKEVLS